MGRNSMLNATFKELNIYCVIFTHMGDFPKSGHIYVIHYRVSIDQPLFPGHHIGPLILDFRFQILQSLL